MKRIHIAAALIFATVTAATVRAGDTNVSSGRDFPSFRLITERNIFDPNRSGRTTRTPSAPERRVATESFVLLGTMSYEKGRFAFFDGSSSQYRKALQPAENIAGFKVTEVTLTCVRLEATNGQAFELCVGMQMKKREETEWQLAGTPAGSDGTNTSVAKTDGGGDADEVLKRLMQRREQDGAAPAGEAVSAPVVAETKSAEPKKNTADESGGDEVLKKLLQKREQELNK